MIKINLIFVLYFGKINNFAKNMYSQEKNFLNENRLPNFITREKNNLLIERLKLFLIKSFEFKKVI